jgi:hypothetical protein
MSRRLDKLLDVMKVPDEGDVLQAVVTVNHAKEASDQACDILVVGGGMGGVAGGAHDQ